MFSLDQLIQNYIDGIVAEKDAVIASLDAQIEGLNAELMAKNNQIAQLQQQVANLTAVVESQAAQITVLQDDIVTLNATIATQTQAIADRDAQIAALTSQISALQAQIVTLTATVAARDAQIATLQAELAACLAGGGGGGEPEPPPATPLPEIVLAPNIHRSFYQEDVPEGAVASWQSRGRAPVLATQGVAANQPVKQPANAGVYFQKAATKWLQWNQDLEAAYSHRWWLVIARADVTAGTNGNVFAINGMSGGQTQRQPYVFFDNPTNQLKSNTADSVARTLGGAVSGTVGDWQVGLFYRRGFTMGGVVNGASVGTHDFAGFRVPNSAVPCFMGHNAAAMGTDVHIDSIIIGDGELTDKQIDVLVGWAHWRAGRQSLLPVGHPFKDAAPVAADMTEYHSVEQYDASAWTDWKTATDAVVATHRGEQTYSEAGYKRVFFTDFDQADQLPASDLTGGKTSPWFAPGHLTTRAELASVMQSNGTPYPLAYVQDTSGTGTLTIRLYHDGSKWITGAMYSVNNNGAGRTWGKGIFKCRMKYSPALTAPLPGIFDAFWGYGHEHLIQRTRNRVEQDWMETTGKDAKWADANLHIHKGKYPFAPDPTILTGSDVSKRLGDRVIDPPEFPSALNIFDGEWHEFVCKVDDDLTYIYAGIGGVLYETARMPTNPELSMLKYLIVDRALSTGHGNRSLGTSEVIDLVVDYVEVLQKESDLLVVPTGFSALPGLAGTLAIGDTLTVVPNTVGSQIDYLWYRDGVPIVGASTASYVLVAVDAGHTIRAHVKNRGLVNQPEAWTAEVAV